MNNFLMKLLPELYYMLIVPGIIFFGSIVHATSQLKIARDKKKEFNKIDFFILTIIASFAGLVFGLVALLFFDNQITVILFSAIGSFLGMAGLNKISSILLDFLTSRVNSKN